MRHLLLAVLLGAGLSSCSLLQDTRRATFACDGGAGFAVSFSGDKAVMEAGGRSYALTQQMTGSGIHYAGEGQDLRGKGPDMTWTDSSGARQCRDQAAAPPQTAQVPRALAGSYWRLVHFQPPGDAAPRVPLNVFRYRLYFHDDGNLTLQLDCNRAMGKWTATPTTTGGTLTMEGGAMTRAFCGAGALDTQIARDLPRVRGYSFAGANLSLTLEEGGGTYLWAPADPMAR